MVVVMTSEATDADIEQVCHDTETEYCFLPTDQPLDEALRRFLLLRSQ